MPVPGNTFVKAREGVLSLRNLKSPATIWTGSKWADATISAGDPGEIANILTASGVTTQITPTTKFNISGRENYYWKFAVDLAKDDCLCLGMPDGRRIRNWENRFGIDYWWGYIFATGITENNELSINIDKC